MHGIRLIAVDLDGTLLTSREALAPEGARLLNQAAKDGARVVLSTARRVEQTRIYCQEMDLHDPMICMNGAQILGSPDGPEWASYTIPLDVAMAVAQMADERDWAVSTTVGAITYWRKRPGLELGPLAPSRMVVSSNCAGIVGEPARMLAFEAEAITCLEDLCRERFSQQCHTEIYQNADGSAHSLGIFPLEADKGTALRLVLGRLGIAPGEMLAIGDNFSDLPMFALAGASVAMGNAPEPVKRKASVVAPGNDEEGVAWAIKTFLY